MPAQKRQNTTIRAEVRKVVKVGDSSYLSLPPEFVKEHGLKPGDSVPVVYNGVLMVTPIPEAKEEPAEKVELEYTEIVEPEERILIPVSGDPVRAFLDGSDPFYEQIKNKYPDYKISHVDMTTVRLGRRKYYQPSRIVVQRIRGITVPPIEE